MNSDVYIVDDNPDHHFLIYQIIKKLNKVYSVKFFEDGRILYRHLEVLRRQGDQQYFPGLIILDLHMPGLNGLQLLKLLKQPLQKTTDDIPVIIMSSETSKDKIVQCYQAGANAFIYKPLEYDQMRLTMQSIFEFWVH